MSTVCELEAMGPVEIVDLPWDLPIEHGGSFQFVLLIYQRIDDGILSRVGSAFCGSCWLEKKTGLSETPTSYQIIQILPGQSKPSTCVEFREVFNAFVCHDCNSATSRFPEVEHPCRRAARRSLCPIRRIKPTEASIGECHCGR